VSEDGLVAVAAGVAASAAGGFTVSEAGVTATAGAGAAAACVSDGLRVWADFRLG
jgi:hypothetical protein